MRTLTNRQSTSYNLILYILPSAPLPHNRRGTPMQGELSQYPTISAHSIHRYLYLRLQEVLQLTKRPTSPQVSNGYHHNRASRRRPSICVTPPMC